MNSGRLTNKAKLARPVFINSSQPKTRTCSLAPFTSHKFSSVLPLRGALGLRGPDAEPAVLLAVDVPALRRLDAHPRGIPQLEVEGLRVFRVGAEAVVVKVEVLAVLT